MTKEELIKAIVNRQAGYLGDNVKVIQDSYGEWVIKYGDTGNICYGEEFILGSDTRKWLRELNDTYP